MWLIETCSFAIWRGSTLPLHAGAHYNNDTQVNECRSCFTVHTFYFFVFSVCVPACQKELELNSCTFFFLAVPILDQGYIEKYWHQNSVFFLHFSTYDPDPFFFLFFSIQLFFIWIFDTMKRGTGRRWICISELHEWLWIDPKKKRSLFNHERSPLLSFCFIGSSFDSFPFFFFHSSTPIKNHWI